MIGPDLIGRLKETARLHKEVAQTRGQCPPSELLAFADEAMEAADRIASLEAENAEIRKTVNVMLDGAANLLSSLATLTAEREALREALAPFAKEAAAWPDHVWDGYGLGHALSVSITIGDLRRAARTLLGGGG